MATGVGSRSTDINGVDVFKSIMKSELDSLDIHPNEQSSRNGNHEREMDVDAVRAAKRTAKKDAKKILELLCADYGKTVEESKVGMKGARKVTYLLKYGFIEHLECFVEEKDSVLLLPHNYTVAFEAACKVWLARIVYIRREDGSFQAQYEVSPVSKQGKELRELSSRPQSNISYAFKLALKSESAINGHITKNVYRPNGRLYLGVFYDTVQQILKDHFQEKLLEGQLTHMKPEILMRLEEWVSNGEKRLLTGNSRRLSDIGLESLGYGNQNFMNGFNQNPKTVTLGTDMARAVLNENAFSIYDSCGTNAPVSRLNQVPGFNTPAKNARDLLKTVAVMGDTSNVAMSSVPMIPLQNFAPLQSTSNVPNLNNNVPIAATNRIYMSKPTNQNAHYSFSTKKMNQFNRTRSDSVTGRRKRETIATNARRLAKAVSEPEKMEEELEAVFKKVLASMEDNHGQDDRSSDDVTIRLLSKLDNLKKMIVQSRQMKRRRTSATGPDDVLKSVEAVTKIVGDESNTDIQNTDSHIGSLKPSASSSSLDSLIGIQGGYNSMSTAQPNAPLLPRGMYQGGMEYYGSQNSASQSSLDRNLPNSRSGNSILLAKDDDMKSVKSGFDYNEEEFQNAVKAANDISTFDFDELMDGNSGAPVVVGCNLTHEGLYLTLDVNRSNNIGEKEIKSALKCLRIPVNSSIVKKIIESCDKNHDGRISMEEFVDYLNEREKELKKMFNEMDISGDGYVTLEELKQARAQGVFEASDAELKSLIEWMDNQEYGWRDGKIEYEEFRTSMILLPPATTMQEIIECFRNKDSK